MLASLALLPMLVGQQMPTSEPATVQIKFAKATAKPGGKVRGTLTMSFAPGLHAYQNPPSDKFQIPVELKVVEKGFKLAKVTYPKGVDFSVPGEEKPAKVYMDTILIPFELKASAKAATYNVNFKVSYQQCNEQACFPPEEATVKAKLVVKKP